MGYIFAMDEQNAETQDLKEDSSDVIFDEYKDMPIELMPSSRKKFLQWNGLEWCGVSAVVRSTLS